MRDGQGRSPKGTNVHPARAEQAADGRVPMHLWVDNPLHLVTIPIPEAVWFEGAAKGEQDTWSDVEMPLAWTEVDGNARPLDGSMEVVRYRAGKVELEIGSRIGWRPGGQRTSPPIDRCLASFVRLADADDAEIVKFARTWGVFGFCVCAEGGPGLHTGCIGLSHTQRWWEDGPQQRAWLRGHGKDLERIHRFRASSWEPIAAWRHYARAYCAMWNISIDLQKGVAPKPEAWRDAKIRQGTIGDEQLADPATWNHRILWPDLGALEFNPPPAVRNARLAHLVSEELHRARVSPWFVWESEMPEVVLALDVVPSVRSGIQPQAGPRLHAVLACQLAAFIASPKGARCVYCGMPFVKASGRRTRIDARPVCEDEQCQQKSNADRQRRFRARSKRPSTTPITTPDGENPGEQP